jgi:tetratricopeptide (TPR) repeat protein
MIAMRKISRGRGRYIFLLILLSLWHASPLGSLANQHPTFPDPNTPGRRLAVAVLFFEDRTGDPNANHWSYAASSLLGDQLSEVSALRLLSSRAVLYGCRRIGLAAGEPIDPNTARKVGEVIEAQRLIWGAYSGSKTRWRVEASILNVASGQISRLSAAIGSDWFSLVDRLREQALDELAIMPSDQEKTKMARRWTSSADALEAYSRAYASQEQGEPVLKQGQLMRQALTADPNCTRALVGLAATLATEGKYGNAEDAVRRALQIDGNSAPALNVLGQLVMLQKQSEEAEILLRRAWRLEPDDATYPMVLAQLSMAQGKRAQGAAFLEAAAALDRTNADVRASLALVYAIQGLPDQAIEEIKEVERIGPEGVYALKPEQMLGQTYELLSRKPEAITHYERLVAAGTKLKINPTLIENTEQKIERLKADLAPTFVEVPMPTSYTVETLSAAIADRLTDEEIRSTVNPLVCNTEMSVWAEQLTKLTDSDLDKARALFEALSKRAGATGLPAVRTAQEVFAAWNDPEVPLLCGDHAVLFIALARAVGLDAFFAYVGKDPHGQIIHHACAAVMAEGRMLLVDPAWRWFGAPHQEFEVLDDLKTVAMFCFVGERTGTKRARCRVGLKLWPDSLFGRLSLVNALREDRQFQQAEALLDEIPEPVGQSWNVYFYHSQHATFALMQGDIDRAYESIQKALTAYPDGDTRYVLATILAGRGQLWQAREEFRRTLRGRVTPDTADVVRRHIAQINERIGFEPVRLGPEPAQTP